MLSVIILRDIMLSVIMLSEIILSVVILSDFMLSDVMHCVVLPNVLATFFWWKIELVF
jgi:hypothetical protein